jgi:hypothetical protein
MVLKRFFPFCFCVILSVYAVTFGQIQGVPYTLWVASYATDTYIGQTPTVNAQLIADNFYPSMVNKLNASPYKSSIGINNYISRRATSDTYNNYINDNQSLCEFLVFSGHGDNDDLNFYNAFTNISAKRWGGDTKWIFSYSCKTLAPFGEQHDTRWINDYYYAFNGAHGLFGFASLVYGSSAGYRCGFLWTTWCYHLPTGLWDDFFQRWMINKEAMWNAWQNSVWDQVYVNLSLSGVEPAACGVGTNGDNGTYVNGLFETIDKVYRAPMPANPRAMNSCYSRFGTPNF